MIKKIKNQPPKSKSNEQLDIIYLAKLQDVIEQTNELLANIFAQLSIDAERMAKIRDSLDNNPPKGIWTLKQAQEYLDVIIANASFGQRQILENNGRLVQVSALLALEEKN